MPEPIDLAAARRSGQRREANVQAAMHEAAQIQTDLQVALDTAHANALLGWDPSDAIAVAQAAHQRLGAQLRFAADLAERAQIAQVQA